MKFEIGKMYFKPYSNTSSYGTGIILVIRMNDKVVTFLTIANLPITEEDYKLYGSIEKLPRDYYVTFDAGNGLLKQLTKII